MSSGVSLPGRNGSLAQGRRPTGIPQGGAPAPASLDAVCVGCDGTRTALQIGRVVTGGAEGQPTELAAGFRHASRLDPPPADDVSSSQPVPRIAMAGLQAHPNGAIVRFEALHEQMFGELAGSDRDDLSTAARFVAVDERPLPACSAEMVRLLRNKGLSARNRFRELAAPLRSALGAMDHDHLSVLVEGLDFAEAADWLEGRTRDAL